MFVIVRFCCPLAVPAGTSSHFDVLVLYFWSFITGLDWIISLLNVTIYCSGDWTNTSAVGDSLSSGISKSNVWVFIMLLPLSLLFAQSPIFDPCREWLPGLKYICSRLPSSSSFWPSSISTICLVSSPVEGSNFPTFAVASLPATPYLELFNWNPSITQLSNFSAESPSAVRPFTTGSENVTIIFFKPSRAIPNIAGLRASVNLVIFVASVSIVPVLSLKSIATLALSVSTTFSGNIAYKALLFPGTSLYPIGVKVVPPVVSLLAFVLTLTSALLESYAPLIVVYFSTDTSLLKYKITRSACSAKTSVNVAPTVSSSPASGFGLISIFLSDVKLIKFLFVASTTVALTKADLSTFSDSEINITVATPFCNVTRFSAKLPNVVVNATSTLLASETMFPCESVNLNVTNVLSDPSDFNTVLSLSKVKLVLNSDDASGIVNSCVKSSWASPFTLTPVTLTVYFFPTSAPLTWSSTSCLFSVFNVADITVIPAIEKLAFSAESIAFDNLTFNFVSVIALIDTTFKKASLSTSAINFDRFFIAAG